MMLHATMMSGACFKRQMQRNAEIVAARLKGVTA